MGLDHIAERHPLPVDLLVLLVTLSRDDDHITCDTRSDNTWSGALFDIRGARMGPVSLGRRDR